MDITSIIPQFGSVFMMIVSFILALSVIVAVHEYGHYIVGRLSGIKADVFSLGFGPILFSRIDKHGTRWQLALFPLGGYVKFMGDANAASANVNSDLAQEMPPEQLRQTMHGAPLWARSATVAAGPIFNFILSILIYSAMMLNQGKAVEPMTIASIDRQLTEGVTLQPGDELLKISGQRLPGFEEGDAFEVFLDGLPDERLLAYEVRRGGKILNVDGPHFRPPLAGFVAPQSAAFDIGMEKGDLITHVGGQRIYSFLQIQKIVEASDGRVLQLDVLRNGQPLEFVLAPRRVDEPQPGGGIKTNWRIGIGSGLALEPATERLGIGAALEGGVQRTWQVITTSLAGVYHLVIGNISSCNVTGLIGIAEVSGAMASQGAATFISLIAFLSTAVGLLNLFPIPVLDGGHLVFYGYEAVRGKPPSEKALRVLMAAGLTLILSLMVFALITDVVC